MTNDFIKANRKFWRMGDYQRAEILPHVVCEDGFTMSVQASSGHYCRPEEDDGPYTHVEVGYPSAIEEDLLPYAEDDENPTGTVYWRVPVGLVDDVIKKHGGLKG